MVEEREIVKKRKIVQKKMSVKAARGKEINVTENSGKKGMWVWERKKYSYGIKNFKNMFYMSEDVRLSVGYMLTFIRESYVYWTVHHLDS